MIDFFVSLLYPKRCVGCKRYGSFICADCFSKISFAGGFICPICTKPAINGITHPKCEKTHAINGIISSIAYKGIVKKLLYQFKYKPYLSELKRPLGVLLYEGLIQNEAFNAFLMKNNLWITSVPLHKKKNQERGYNHASLLGKVLATKLKIKFVPDILIRIRPTKPQFELKRIERIRNVDGAFKFNPKYKEVIKDKNILLVDDIVTTGSTLKECGKVLKRNGAMFVLGVVLAHESKTAL